MPLDRFVLYLVLGAASVVALVYGGLLLFSALHVGPLMLVVLVPIGLVVFVFWRVLVERLASREDDHYENIDS